MPKKVTKKTVKALKRDLQCFGWTVDYVQVWAITAAARNTENICLDMETTEAVILAMVALGYARLDEKEQEACQKK